MNDLTHRLRQWAINTDATPASDLMEEAANEIDRLRQALQKNNNPNALLAAYQLGVRHSTEQSPSGSGCSAPERQSPASDRDGGEPLDDCAPTRDHAPGGRGHSEIQRHIDRLKELGEREAAAALWDLRKAAAERQPQTCPYVVGRTTLYCSLTPFTLTDEEREAVRFFSKIAGPHNVPVANKRAATLRGLLERTK